MKQLQWKPVNVHTLKDLTPEAQLKIGQNIVDQFDTWRNLRMGEEMLWNEIDRQCNQFDPLHTPLSKLERNTTIDGPTIMGSKLKMCNTYAHIEGFVASMMKYLFANEYDFFDIGPLDPMDMPATQAVKEYLIWLYGVMDFENDYKPFVRSIASYGTGIASYEWIEETAVRWKTMEVTDPETGQTQLMRYQAQDVIYNAPKFTPLNLYRCVIDPTARDVKTATLIFQKMVTPYEIMANPAYGAIDQEWVFGVPDAGADQYSQSETLREQARGNSTYDATTALKGKKMVYEAWGDFTDGYTLYQNYVAEVLGNRLIRFEPNPYDMPHKPFIIARANVEPGRIYGRPLMVGSTGIQAGMDTIVNQVIDANAMHNERPILLLNNALVQDKNDRKTAPPLGKNVIWRVRDLQAAERMRDQDFVGVANSIQLINILSEQLKLGSGDNELMSGGGGISDQYATTGHVVQVAEAGNSRFNLYAKTVEQESIVPMLEMTIDLLRQRTLAPVTLQTRDTSLGPTVQFHPEMLLNNMAFTLRGASYNATRQLSINASQSFYTLLSQNPITNQIMNWVRVVIDMGDLLGIRGIRNQLQPQAVAALQQAPQQPTWWQNVMNIFTGQQQAQATGNSPDIPGPQGSMPQIPGTPNGLPGPGGSMPMPPPSGGMNIGQQFGNQIAPSSGGTQSGGTSQSPFNVAPQAAPPRHIGGLSRRGVQSGARR